MLVCLTHVSRQQLVFIGQRGRKNRHLKRACKSNAKHGNCGTSNDQVVRPFAEGVLHSGCNRRCGLCRVTTKDPDGDRLDQQINHRNQDNNDDKSLREVLLRIPHLVTGNGEE